jgi:uncharacterized protein with HEPN domain
MWRDQDTVRDIADACGRILAFCAGTEEEAFARNEEKHWAVAGQLMVIGEAVTRLSPGFRECHAGIPWRQIAGMRNRLIHGYDDINWTRVWLTVQEDIEPLAAFCEGILRAGEAQG